MTVKQSARNVVPGTLLVGTLTALALALRAAGIRQGLFGDELILLDVVDGRNLGGMLDRVHETESTPPFHFLLAWAASKVGDPAVWIRVPSLVLGAATVPVTYLIGTRTIGSRGALIAAAVVALSPFAVFYGTEGRAYATLAFLAGISTLSLLRAVESKRVRWWALYAVSSCLITYTHYTGIFVLVAQAAWAWWAYRGVRRELVAANAAVVVAYLPWVPSLLFQSEDSAANRISAFSPLSVDSFFRDTLKFLTGHPFVPLGELPGLIPLGLFGLAVGAGLLNSLLGMVRERHGAEASGASRRLVLIAALTLATPVGLLLYSLPAKSIVGPRTMSASLPAAALLIGWALSSLRPRLAALTVALVLGALSIGTAKTLDDDHQRPATPEVADYIDERATAGDSVVSFLTGSLFFAPPDMYFGRRHDVFKANVDDREAWNRAAHGSSVFLILPQRGPFVGVPPFAGPGGRFILHERKTFPGLVGMAVGRYRGKARFELSRRDGREVIVVSPGKDLIVEPGAVRGVVDRISVSGDEVIVQGWAGDPRRDRVAEVVFGFSGGRLFAVGFFALARPDVAKAYGEALRRSGFLLSASSAHPDELADPSRLRVLATVEGRASDLKLTERARSAAAASVERP